MKKLLFSFAAASMMLACSSSQSTLSNAQSGATEDSKLSAVLWQQTSAEYEALCHQAFNVATYRLNIINNSDLDVIDQETGAAMVDQTSPNKKMAIVMDLDETVLDNSPYNGWLIENNKTYNVESWTEWCNIAKAELVPGALEFIEKGLSGLLEPDIKETIEGSAEIQKIFKVSGSGQIAGSKIIDGEIKNKSKARLIRDGVVVYTGEISSIFREKNQVKSVTTGLECGISLKDFIDFKEKDIIESFLAEKIERKI